MIRTLSLVIILLFAFHSIGCTPTESKKAIFNDICSIIDNHFYDADFKGIDWERIKKIYSEKISENMSEAEFYELINTMFKKFDVSHLEIFHPGMPDNLLQLAMKEGWAGINLKVIEQKIVVTRVVKDSPAENLGIKKGTIIRKINGKDITEIKREADQFRKPPFNERSLLAMLNIRTEYQTFGNIGKKIELQIIAEGKERTVAIERIERPGKTVMVEGTPPNFIEFEKRLLDNEVGYIRFNYFAATILDEILNAVDQYKEKKGIIIDIRNNYGGMFEVRKTLADRFGKERSLLWRQNGRRGVNDIFISLPQEQYEGKLVLLTNVVSASSAEEFAGGLQALGLATIIGEKTQGRVLVADFSQIKPGVMMMYPVAITTLANGETLENYGVTPDIEVHNSIEMLQKGRDNQLEKAIEFIKIITNEE